MESRPHVLLIDAPTGVHVWADHFDGMLPHLGQRDVSFVAVSRAPLAEIRPFQKRMGWSFKWVSSSANDFNYDFNVSFTAEQRDLSAEEVAAPLDQFRSRHPIIGRIFCRIPGWNYPDSEEELMDLARSLRGVAFRPTLAGDKAKEEEQ